MKRVCLDTFGQESGEVMGVFVGKGMKEGAGARVCLCIDLRGKGCMFRIFLSCVFITTLHFRQRAWVLH